MPRKATPAQQPLTADRLDQRVGRVDADQHQDEQEQHQDGAGVDDDLDREQERRVLRGVLDGQADHHGGEQQCRVHRLADQDHRDRGQHHDRCQHPERDLAAGDETDHLSPPPSAGAAAPDQAEVVVLVGGAELHLVRRLLHPRQQRGQQVLLLVDEGLAAAVGQLVLVRHRQRPGRARLDAESAQDAAQVVDLVHPAVALAGRHPPAVGVVSALDVDRVRRAGPRAQLAADALLQPVGPAVQLVPAVEPRRGRLLVERVLLGEHLAEHRPEGDAEPGYGIPEGLFDASHG